MGDTRNSSLLNGLQSAVSAAQSSDLPDVVKVMHTDHHADTSLLEDEFKEQIKFMDLIWTDAVNGGGLFEKLYPGVTRQQIIEAGRPGTHAEVLAVNELIKELKVAGKFTALDEDLLKIQILTKGQTDYGEARLELCVHCFYLLPGVKMIGS
jgi:hypothetical protein